ncbi:MAG: hypothetical protein NTY77_18155 [Elusimicrobia bacterium]|nr:hypothetical protein [Elusimicrobiota bacterium]
MRNRYLHAVLIRRAWLAGALLALPISLAAQEAAKGPWTPAAGISVKEYRDDNVLLQDQGDQARRKSWVTDVTPSLGVTYQDTRAFKALFSYAPEIARFHSQPSENYAAHRGSLNLSGATDAASWEVLNSAVWIDGSDQGPSFTGGGDVPAIGGIPIRDRRRALVLRNGFKATRTLGRWFVRPLFNSYVHDFRTRQFSSVGVHTGYENYISRYELSGGADLGFEAFAQTRLFAGYRVGRQHQGELLGAASPYSNDYHRVLLGAEGSPAGWLKFNLAAGPDFRYFAPGTAANFDRRKTLWYYDASLTLTPGLADVVALAAKRYAQPAFSSQSLYEDVVYDLDWKHRFCDQLTAGAGFRTYAGLWLQPVQRRDWIYTGSLSVSYKPRKGLGLDLAYSHDSVSSAVPNTSGRTFMRNLVSLEGRYSF